MFPTQKARDQQKDEDDLSEEQNLVCNVRITGFQNCYITITVL